VASILDGTARGGAGSRALVLMDEVMAGTNPDQGAALARATAEALADRPVLAVVTTHYDSLKALGESDPRFANAGMEYDLAHLRPTFRLAVGAPGRSFAFDIAARMGLPPTLLARARELAGASSVGLEAVIARLEEREAELAKESARLATAEAAAAASAAEQSEAAAALQRRERELGRDARTAVEAAIAETRTALAAIVRGAQQAGTARAAEAARGELGRVADAALAKLPAPAAPSAPPTAIMTVGARVFVERLGAEGIMAQAPDARGRAKVTIGALTVDVTVEELRPSTGGARRAARTSPPGRPAAPAQPRPDDELALVAATSSRTLDLRGQSGDEALPAIEAYLDRAALSGESYVVIVHGHGTGALRKRVRAYLDQSPYVSRWAPGTPRQGGDGAVIVELR
jgi:DNA mismatch repair protein MutS2